jgi:outer membrane protein OmpA-like peptidoglycan-associated protein
MAELNVQPKKKPAVLPWILLAFGIIALIWFLTRNKDTSTAGTTADDTTTTTTANTPTTPTETSAGSSGYPDWSGVDLAAPSVKYEEITDKDIETRGTGNYGIYGVGEKILFDEGKATIRPQAEKHLKQVTASINKRYNTGDIRIYGYTDSQGDASANKELAQQRADAVKNWLQNNGIAANRLSVNAVGEAKPVADNSYGKGTAGKQACRNCSTWHRQ